MAPIVDEALDNLNLNYDFDIISDIQSISEAGITKPPAITINDNIITEGYTPSVDELVKKIKTIEN